MVHQPFEASRFIVLAKLVVAQARARVLWKTSSSSAAWGVFSCGRILSGFTNVHTSCHCSSKRLALSQGREGLATTQAELIREACTGAQMPFHHNLMKPLALLYADPACQYLAGIVYPLMEGRDLWSLMRWATLPDQLPLAFASADSLKSLKT